MIAIYIIIDLGVKTHPKKVADTPSVLYSPHRPNNLTDPGLNRTPS